MGNISKVFFLSLFTIISCTAYTQTNFGKHLTKKNSQSIISHLSQSVDIKIGKKQDIYSRKQAIVVINNFFQKHPIFSFKTVHQSTSKNGMRFLVGDLKSSNSTFKFAMKFNGDEKSEIQSISISTP